MAAKKKTARKRPPRQVWIVFHELSGSLDMPQTKKSEAEIRLGRRPFGARVVGPYVLAERTREQ
jgi:hypothetical protein